MRITQVMLCDGVGGVERIVPDMCLSLAEAGHQVQLIVNAKFSLLEECKHPNLQVFAVKVHGRRDPFARYRVSLALKKFRPSVVHLHLRQATTLVNVVCQRLGIATCTSMHNYGNPSAYDKVDKILVPTLSMQAHLTDAGISAEKIHLVPNFSRMALAPPAGEFPDSPALFAFGRFIRKKGFDTLIEAIHLLKMEGDKLSLSLAGGGELQSEYESLTAQYGLEAQITILPWQVDVTPFIDKHDIFILPSRDEPFGLVILETMARGKLVISSRTLGPTEVLDDNTAYLFEIDSAVELKSRIQEALNNPQQSLEKARLSQQTYIDKYSHHKFVENFELIYANN